ncbi:aminopeptidase Q-like [Ornithodoros turicata]|uniref:aminopeptidase Q-like n=1 Tax=Ornithodoros turicata TaxID=34597 RepID=UPI003139B738
MSARCTFSKDKEASRLDPRAAMATTSEPLLERLLQNPQHPRFRDRLPEGLLRMGRTAQRMGNSSDHEVRNFIVFSCLIGVVLLLSFFAVPNRSRATSATKGAFDSWNQEGDISSQTERRSLLPRNVVPFQYDLELNVSRPEQLTYHGRVNIVLECLVRGSTTITLHAANLSVHDVNISTFTGNQQITHIIVKKSDTEDVVVLDLGFEMIDATVYNLTMLFEGTYRNDTIGMFARSFDGLDRKVSTIVTTNLLFGRARFVFPCLDEPDMRAAFNVSLIRQREFDVAFSTEVQQTRILEGDDRKDTFAMTPPIAPFQLGFSVFKNFDSINDGYSRLFALPSEISDLHLALKASVKMLKYLEATLGPSVAYPFHRYQIVVLPNLLDSVQPSWALITMASSSISYDEDNGDTSRLADVLSSLAHAVAHQWLGNLVSPKAWADIWYIEGLASLFEDLMLKWVYPDQVPPSYFGKKTREVMNIEDAKGQNRGRLTSMSSVCYNPVVRKARVIMDLLFESATPDLFLNALIEFLKNNSYHSANVRDLLIVFTEKSGISDMSWKIESWIRNVGYPLVHVRRLSRRRRGFKLTQGSFCWNNRRCFNQTWPTAVKYSVFRNGSELWNGKVWLLKQETELHINITTSDTVLFNSDGTGFYRVNYDPAEWARVVTALQESHASIHPSMRLKLLDDLFIMAETGLTPYTYFFSAASYLQNETDMNVWSVYGDIATYLDKFLLPSQLGDRWRAFNAKLSNRLIASFVQASSSGATKALKTAIFKHACWYGEEHCLSLSRQVLNTYITEGATRTTHVLPDAVLLCTGIRYGSAESWDMLWSKVFSYSSKAPFSYTLVPILQGLSCTSDPARLWRLLNATLTSDLLKKHHSFVLRSAAVSSMATHVLVDFVFKNWDMIGKTGDDRLTADEAFGMVAKEARSPSAISVLSQPPQKLQRLEIISAAHLEATARSQSDLTWHRDHAGDLVKALSNVAVANTRMISA